MLGATGTLSTPMGDATQTGGPKSVILDSYGRAFDVDFSGTLNAAKSTPTLEPALAIGTQTRVTVVDNMSVALSVANRSGSVSLDRLDLSPADRQQVRAIAASVITKLGNDKSLAIGIARSSGALIDQMSINRASSFIAADAVRSNFGFYMRPKSAFAYQQTVGRTGLYFGSEIGDARVWPDGIADPMRGRYQNHRYNLAQAAFDRTIGTAKLSLGGTYLDERETVLGSATNIWIGATGAKSWFADAKLELGIGNSWQLGGAYRRGWTRIGAAGFRQNADWLQTEATSIDLTRFGVFSVSDQLALRFSQPLRVTGGGVNLNLPNSYDYANLTAGFESQYVSLAPKGRERDVELAYTSALWGGRFGANLYLRQQPGNIADASSDIGLAFRFSRTF
jgi:hypothetical protein